MKHQAIKSLTAAAMSAMIAAASVAVLAATFTMLTAPAPASAQGNAGHPVCSFYAKVGGTVVDFMLPLTMQELVNMMTGRDQALMAAYTGALLKVMTGEEVVKVAEYGADAAALLGEAAGQTSLQLLMSAQVTSSAEVVAFMEANCNKVGPDQVLAAIRQAKAATAPLTGE